MAKDKKEKREPKTDKKALLRVKSKNKFKKKAVANESGGIEEQSTVIIEDQKTKRVGKGEKNMMAKLMKKKLIEKMNKKIKSSAVVKNEEKIGNEGKISNGKEKKNKKVKRSVEVKNEEKISSENEEEKITYGKEKKKMKNKAIKKKDLKLKKKEKKSKDSFEENEEKLEETSQLDEESSKGIKRKSIEENEEITAEEISLVDEDSSKGMKQWLKEYKDSRLDTDVLLNKIDDFIIAHEAKLEQEKKEREAKLWEEGWTVVTHNKGRKKSTDAETGTGFGSVNEAAVLDRLANKKRKNETHLEFYGFQRRQAHRSEIMKLQSEFEKDKKLVQQMKAARKFRP